MAVGELPPEARVIPSLKQAWTNIWPHFWWLLLFTVISTLASSGGDSSGQAGGPVAIVVGIGGALLTIFVGIPLSVGLVKVNLVASRGDKPTWGDLGYAFSDRYWAAIGVSLLSALIVIGGLILLIIPGIFWGVKLSFVAQRFIEDDLGVLDSIKASFADVAGRWWNVFGLGLISIPLVIAGVWRWVWACSSPWC